MNRTGYSAALVLVCAVWPFFAGCGGGGAASSVTVEIIAPITGTSVDVGATRVLTFSADVGGDPTNRGVGWKLSGTSCSGNGCGTLTPDTTQPTSVTHYTAPTALPSNAALSVTLTATANADGTTTKTVTITVQPAPTFTTTNCNPANQTNPCILVNGANGVTYNQTISITGGVEPYTFSVTNGPLPDGLNMSPAQTSLASTSIQGRPKNPGTPGGSPVAFPFTVQVTDTGGATSVSQNYQITVNPPPQLAITTTSLPNATRQMAYSQPISITGGVAPSTWSIVSGGLPPSMSLAPKSGVISGTPGALDVLQSTCFPAVPATYCFTVQVQDSTLPASQTKTQALAITIQQPPPLQITPTVLPGGQTGTAYVASLQGTGGIQPYTWTVTQGQLPAGLTLATLSDGTGSISGTPVVANPAGHPSTFSVQLADSAGDTPVSAQFSINVTAGASNDALLNGAYEFLFNGFDSGGAVYIVGGITANGQGNITGGTEVINRVSGVVPPPSAPTITGTYTIGSDGRGTMELTATFAVGVGIQPITADYDIAIESNGTARFFQYHPKTPPSNADTGTNGTGTMKPVLGSGFGPGSFSGNYALEFTGLDTKAKPTAMVGVIHANGSSQTLTPGSCDLNDAGTFGSCVALSGDFNVPTSGLPTASLSFQTPAGTQANLNFVFFFVSPSDLYFVEVDSDKTTGKPTNFFRLSGEMILQRPSVKFGQAAMAGTSVLTGEGVGGGSASVMVGLLSSPLCDGAAANTKLGYDENNSGTVSTLVAFTGTCSIQSTGSNGRAAFSGLGAAGSTRVAVAYLAGPNQGFFLGSDAAVTAGLLEQQTPGLAFSNATVYGSYALGTPFFGDSKSSAIAGEVFALGDGTLSGTVDVSAPPATAPNFTATNSSPDSTGRGTMTTAPALTGFPTNMIYYVVTPGDLRAISADSGDAHPQTVFLDH